ncbi:MAG: M28 family peptidase [Bryobacterales bacterium]|nr:M28 family peptidase [Bryobacterales bacterium]
MRYLLLLSLGLGGQQWTFPTIPAEKVTERLRRIERGENAARFGTLGTLFTEAGCTGPALEPQMAKGSKVPNLVCTLPGEPEGKWILVTAHFDKVRAGAGAIDNWSGASLLPSLYQSLRAVEGRRHTFLFIGFTDEEAGLVGARAWVKANQKTALKNVRAVINIDSVASGPHPLYVWASKADPELTQLALQMAGALKIPLEGMNADQVGTTDAAPFRAKKVPVIDFHSLNNQTWLWLHSIDDQLSKIDVGAYQSAYRFLAAYLKFVDEKLDAPDRSVTGALK